MRLEQERQQALETAEAAGAALTSRDRELSEERNKLATFRDAMGQVGGVRLAAKYILVEGASHFFLLCCYCSFTVLHSLSTSPFSPRPRSLPQPV